VGRAQDGLSYVERNRVAWTGWSDKYARWAETAWARDGVTWGTCRVRDEEIGMLPDVDGMDVVELGCGTAYVSARLQRRGARPVGVDVTPAQLETARAMQRRYGVDFPLLEANAEETGLPDASFDLAISEYGASIWCDPYRWIPEAARLLRPGGTLVFLRNSTTLMLCMPAAGPASEKLVRAQRALHRLEYEDDDSVEFHLGHGEWIRLLREHGFVVEALAELYPVAGGAQDDEYVPVEWARRWPKEEVWRASTRG
jgi:ubiquinone/menaquinone biosynthesis C-methylase UbiE